MHSEWDLGLGLEDRSSLPSEGWHLSATYRFSELFELGLSYSQNVQNSHNSDGKGVWNPEDMYTSVLLRTDQTLVDNDFEAWRKTTTISTRFDINDSWLIKFEVGFNDGFGGYTSAENPTDSNNKLILGRYWTLYAVKMTLNFQKPFQTLILGPLATLRPGSNCSSRRRDCAFSPVRALLLNLI